MITLISWGHKFGMPVSNFKFDVSFLKNPWRDPKLKRAEISEIRKFMEHQEGFRELIDSFVNLIVTYNRLFPGEDLRFAFCCSAGEFRSPSVVQAVHDRLKILGVFSTIEHSKESRL